MHTSPKLPILPLLLICFVRQASGQSLAGRVLDAATKEPLENVELQEAAQNRKTRTNPQGEFQLDLSYPAQLLVQAVGYRLYRVDLAQPSQLEILLTPDALSVTSRIDVLADVFDNRNGSPAPATEYNLSGAELRALVTSLLGDPLRALQSLPGVNGNNDFYAQFSLRGAPFQRIGLVYDGLLLRAPFHTVQGIPDGGSLSIINGDLLGGGALLPGAPPPNFMDRTAGIATLESRDGSEQQTRFRVTANILNASALAEGPLRNRGSWIVSFRHSFQQYIVSRLSQSDPSLAFGFTDVQGKLTWRFTRSQNAAFQFWDAFGGVDRSGARNTASFNALADSNTRSSLLRTNYRFTPSSRILVQHIAAWSRERFENRNSLSIPLAADFYTEWTQNTDINGPFFSLGSSFRQQRTDGFRQNVFSNPAQQRVLEPFRGNGLRAGGYGMLHQDYRDGGVRWTAGMRLDAHTRSNIRVGSPFASLAWTPPRTGGAITLGFGQYVQFPELNQIFSAFAPQPLLPERATHVNLAWDQRINSQTRVRIELYNRADRDLLARPLFDARLSPANAAVSGMLTAPWRNTRRGYSRGWQVTLQRRSANRFNGWIAYSYGAARQRDGIERLSFYADDDQRHTATAFGNYRITPTWSVTSRWSYGSGTPIPGFFEQSGSQYFLAAVRNETRLPAYSRLDLRINKAITWRRWKMTLYGEVLNATNRTNQRLNNYSGFNAATRRSFLSFGNLFPVLPAAGASLDF